MPRIHVLSPEVASRIAAGEVIERPASLLKELLENSLDAGASAVAVESRGAGRKSLLVSDDGSGMDPKDCELCLGRHATSKIESLEDLGRLGTFGFRGEALYAAAAVSRLTVASCARGAKAGWRVEAQGGTAVSSGPAPAVPGTTVEARDLFYNTPARLKFLKSDAFEKSRLVSTLEEAALANPGVRFSYKSEGRGHLLFAPETAKDPLERDRKRLASVLGAETAAGLLPVACERTGFKLRLFVSSPDRLAATRQLQFWLVNRRPVDARVLQQALYRAFSGYRSPDRHPVCVAHLELPPDAFDVNVHPGKREVRFRAEREVFDLVSGLIAATLARERKPAALVPEPRRAPAGTASLANETLRLYSEPAQATSLTFDSGPAAAVTAPEGAPRWYTPPFRYLGQIERSYLVFEASGGIFVLDQHAAAERILFERFLSEIEKGGAKSQKLLLPLTVELPASAAARVLGLKSRLKRLGFEVAALGKTGVQVLAVPSLFHKAKDLKNLAQRLLESYDDPAAAARDSAHDAVATIACKAAVKAHDPLGEKEALRLLSDLKDCRDGSCCPHGRRAMLALTRDELARRFQRPGAPPL